MPKNQIKPEASEPYSEQTSLGGPIPKIGSSGVMPCRLQLSSKILEQAGLKPRDQVLLIAEDGQIIIRKIDEPKAGYPILKPGPKPQLDDLMQWTREKMARARGEEPEDGDEAGEEPGDEAGLNEDQVSREEL